MVPNWNNLEDLPPALKPNYQTEEPNQLIPLYEGDFQIEMAEVEVIVNGKVYLKWFPYPQVEFSVSVNKLSIPSVFEASLKIPELESSIKVSISSISHSDSETGNSTKITGRLKERMEIGSSHHLKYIQFQLTNFENFIGNARAVIEDGKARFAAQRIIFEQDTWRVTIDELQTTKDRLKSVESQGGYVITHVGKLEKLDGTTFAADETLQFLDCLAHFLSFVRGFRVAPLLLVGYDSMDLLIWKQWAVSNAAPWSNAQSWSRGLISRDIAAVFPGFSCWWQEWGNSAKIVIHWYLESLAQAGAVEGACILEYAALELLGWVIFENEFTEDQSLKNGRKFKYPSQKLNHLLANSSVPQAIPVELDNMIALVACNKEWENNAAFAFCEIRNNITHASLENRKRLLEDMPFKVRREAWELGLWYLELILLHLFNYKGQYFNRLPKGLRYYGELEHVPWVAAVHNR